MSWMWMVVAGWIGFMAGFVLAAVMAAGHLEDNE